MIGHQIGLDNHCHDLFMLPLRADFTLINTAQRLPINLASCFRKTSVLSRDE